MCHCISVELVTVIFSRFGLPRCAVCIGDPQDPICLPCHHVYCFACIRQWLVQGHMYCPYCTHSSCRNCWRYKNSRLSTLY
uniref:RING-type domain-containing protein n=1 Tax=Neogobius melanostomus TaxID=47308 RepID=A0A8C6TA92_9GOBI